MILNQEDINYKGKTVFKRLILTKDFAKLPKVLEDNEACFLFLRAGEIYFRTATNHLHVNEGDAMIAKCGNYFIENKTYPTSDQTKNITIIGAFFHAPIVRSFFENDLLLENFNTDADVKKVNVEPLLKTFIDALGYIFDHPEIADENLIKAKLKELLILLSKGDNSRTISSFVQSLFSPQSYNFNEVVQQNLYARLSLSELAFLCNMSLSTFKRQFLKMYGKPPASYFMAKKLERAHHIIKMGKTPISDVAYECGFETVSSFNRAFKKHYGLTPTESRLSQNEN